MALFGGRDRGGTSVDFKGDGSAAAFILQVSVITAIPTALGHFAGTATTTSQTLAAATGSSVPTGATHVRLDVDSTGGDVYYHLDATTAGATTGEVIPAGQAGEIALANLGDVRLRSSTGSVTFRASYRKYN